MTPSTATPPRPTTGDQPQTPAPSGLAGRTDLLWRAGVVVGGAGTSLLDGPPLLTGTPVPAGVGLAAERLAMLRRRGRLDGLLLAFGGALTTLVLVGLVLGATPIGVDRTTWTVGLAVTSLAALAVAATAPRPPAARWGRAYRAAVLRGAPWVAAAAVVVGIALSMSLTSEERNETSPLQMSFGSVEGTRVQVVISGSDGAGPVELRTTTDGNEISYPLVTLDPDRSTTVDVALPTSGRYTITLGRPDQTQPLRTLILDR